MIAANIRADKYTVKCFPYTSTLSFWCWKENKNYEKPPNSLHAEHHFIMLRNQKLDRPVVISYGG